MLLLRFHLNVSINALSAFFARAAEPLFCILALTRFAEQLLLSLVLLVAVLLLALVLRIDLILTATFRNRVPGIGTIVAWTYGFRRL